jgi:FkbM family methyltransferase
VKETAMQTPVLESLLIAYARRFPVRRGKLRVINSLWQVAAGGHGAQRMATLTHAGMKAPCDLTEMLQRQFYFFGTYFLEEAILDYWGALAKTSKVVLDVGANAGIYSLAALAANPATTVHAFEPTPDIAERLRTTAALNGLDRLHVHETAVSDVAGHKTLRRFRGCDDSNGGMNFLTDGPAEAGDESVATISLDVFCEEHGIGHVDLMKMDIQGHEYTALKGAARLLGEGRIGHLFLELNWLAEGDSDCPASACIRLLEDNGYQFSAPDARRQWKPAGPWLRSLSDVVAARPQRKHLS